MVQSDETPDRDSQSSDGDFDPTAVRPETPPASSGRNSRFTPGTVLEERYRIVAPLGKGGMGEVYRAEDLKLGQQVALKFLPRSVARSPADLARLNGEVRIGGRVSHPNVCRLYDIGEWSGDHFIAMEYIDGEDLAGLADQSDRPAPSRQRSRSGPRHLGVRTWLQRWALSEGITPREPEWIAEAFRRSP